MPLVHLVAVLPFVNICSHIGIESDSNALGGHWEKCRMTLMELDEPDINGRVFRIKRSPNLAKVNLEEKK